MKGLIGRKVGMTQMFDERGNVIPITLISLGPCVVLEKKSSDKFGYTAIKLGYEEQKEHRLNKAILGEFKKINQKPVSIIKEIRLNDDKELEQYKLGDILDVSIFQKGEKVIAIGTTKGKGFAGVMKRYNYKGGKASHGAHKVHRKPGSVGAGTDPGRVLPGKNMPGHMGNVRQTVKNLEVMNVDKENNIIAVKGAVPGHKKSIIIVRQH